MYARDSTGAVGYVGKDGDDCDAGSADGQHGYGQARSIRCGKSVFVIAITARAQR